MAPERPVHQSIDAQTDAVIRRLATLPTMPYGSPVAMRFVLGIRWLALCSRKGHDPVSELTARLGSVTAAKAFLDFADLAGAYWPEPVQVMRPCCVSMTPDESVFAAMAQAAQSNDREAFSRTLHGFIRQGRHEALFDAAVEAFAYGS